MQETYVRWHAVSPGTVETPEAWLVTTASRLAIDRLRRLRTEREAYVGPWLPEPIVTAAAPDRHLDLAGDLSIAFLTLLERLAPDERAAFLLHDVFDVGYADDRRGAREKRGGVPPGRPPRPRARARRAQTLRRDANPPKRPLLQRFTAAMEARDEQALLALFAPDATWTADGGGKTAAAPRPIVGADRIARLVLGLREKFWAVNRRIELVDRQRRAGPVPPRRRSPDGRFDDRDRRRADPRRLRRGQSGQARLNISLSHNPRPSVLAVETERRLTTMNPRIDITKYLGSGMGRAMLALSSEVSARLEPSLFELVKIRASQINGCAYCIDMHTKEARRAGETEQRIYALNAWRETPFFSARERAALEWTEAVTRVADTHVPDELYQRVAAHFEEAELVALTLGVSRDQHLEPAVGVVPAAGGQLSADSRRRIGSREGAPRAGDAEPMAGRARARTSLLRSALQLGVHPGDLRFTLMFPEHQVGALVLRAMTSLVSPLAFVQA